MRTRRKTSFRAFDAEALGPKRTTSPKERRSNPCELPDKATCPPGRRTRRARMELMRRLTPERSISVDPNRTKAPWPDDPSSGAGPSTFPAPFFPGHRQTVKPPNTRHRHCCQRATLLPGGVALTTKRHRGNNRRGRPRATIVEDDRGQQSSRTTEPARTGKSVERLASRLCRRGATRPARFRLIAAAR